jgi:hypothetical protein
VRSSPFGLAPLSTVQQTSTGTGDTKTITAPLGAAAALIGVETTDARVTFDGSAPTAGNGVVFKQGAQPVLLPIRKGVQIKFAATAAANSVMGVAFFT